MDSYEIEYWNKKYKLTPPWDGGPPVDLFHRPDVFSLTRNEKSFETRYIIVSLLLCLCGGYLGGATVNSRWLPQRWNWRAPNTPIAVMSGAVGGLILPLGVHSSNASIGETKTALVAVSGAYLGAAAMNKQWKFWRWNWKSPATYYGAFQGFQTGVWLIDATTDVRIFNDESNLKRIPRKLSTFNAYRTGLVVALQYGANYHNGDFNVFHWNFKDPGTINAMVEGMESGVGIPIGFSRIGRWFANRTNEFVTDSGMSLDGRQRVFSKDDFASIYGAGFMAYLYASEVNVNWDFRRWNWTDFDTLEAIANGIVTGKDLPIMVQDVKNSFKWKRENPYNGNGFATQYLSHDPWN